jgi:hypothetical protein
MSLRVIMSPDDIRALDAHQLSRIADCGSPGNDTDGAEFLRDVRDAVMEAFDDLVRIDGVQGWPRSALEESLWQSGPPLDHRDHAKWLAFVQLEAYRATPEGIEHCHDMGDMADLALRDIFTSLVSHLTAHLYDWAGQQELDDDGTA